jgi:heptosyltransferase III
MASPRAELTLRDSRGGAASSGTPLAEQANVRPRRALLLQCRNYGDAVIGTGLIEALASCEPRLEMHVLTRPWMRSLFNTNPFVSRVHEAEFPMGTDKRFGTLAALRLARRIGQLRRQHFDLVIQLTGDVREIALGRLIAPKDNCGLLWEEGHLQRRIVRQRLERWVSSPVPIRSDELNIYSAIQSLAAFLGARAPARPRLYDPSGKPYAYHPHERAVGIHMVAGQRCREWPIERWRGLIEAIKKAGLDVVVFGAPADRERLTASLGNALDDRVELVTGSLENFFGRLARVRAFVGLDSFSIHAAYAVGVPSIMLNGASRAEIWCPPGTEFLDGGAGLACHPCFNKPVCTSSESPYQCVRVIPEAKVVRLLERLGAFAP